MGVGLQRAAIPRLFDRGDRTVQMYFHALIPVQPQQEIRYAGRHRPCAKPRPAFYHGNLQSKPPGSRRQLQADPRSEEHTSELQSLMRLSYAAFCLKKKK